MWGCELIGSTHLLHRIGSRATQQGGSPFPWNPVLAEDPAAPLEFRHFTLRHFVTHDELRSVQILSSLPSSPDPKLPLCGPHAQPSGGSHEHSTMRRARYIEAHQLSRGRSSEGVLGPAQKPVVHLEGSSCSSFPQLFCKIGVRQLVERIFKGRELHPVSDGPSETKRPDTHQAKATFRDRGDDTSDARV